MVIARQRYLAYNVTDTGSVCRLQNLSCLAPMLLLNQALACLLRITFNNSFSFFDATFRCLGVAIPWVEAGLVFPLPSMFLGFIELIRHLSGVGGFSSLQYLLDLPVKNVSNLEGRPSHR